MGSDRLETPFENDGLVGESEVLSPDAMNIKQEDTMDIDILHGDTTTETDEMLDDTNDDNNANVLTIEEMKDPVGTILLYINYMVQLVLSPPLFLFYFLVDS